MPTAVRIGCKISGTVKGKLSLGTQTLQLGGIRRVSSRFLSWRRREAVEGLPIQYLSNFLNPYEKDKESNQSKNIKKSSQKYINNFEFWFMGFLNYQKAFNCLQPALSQSWLNYKWIWKWFKEKCFFPFASSNALTWSKNKAFGQSKPMYKFVFLLMRNWSTIILWHWFCLGLGVYYIHL